MTQHTTTSAESSPTAKGAHEVAPDGVDGPATILHVVDATPGGAEIEAMVADAVAALSAAGHRSIVASTGGPWVHTLARAGAEAVTLPLESRNPFARHAALRRLAGLMRRERVDLVHAWLLGPARRVGPLAKSEGLPFLLLQPGFAR